jgi:undecaprenyl-diphosphatase
MFQKLDTALFYLVNISMHHPMLDPIMIFITKKSYILFLIILLLLVPKYRTRLILPLLLSFIAIGLSDGTGNIIKHLFERARPFAVLSDVNKLVNAHAFSFPSNHAANAFAFATVFYIFYPIERLRYAFIAVALLVCFSRVYVGVHYPSDVLGGALLGTIIALSIIGLYNWLSKRVKKSNPHSS